MLDLIAKLVNIPSYTGNFAAAQTILDLCRNFVAAVDPAIYMLMSYKNGYPSLLLTRVPPEQQEILSVVHVDVVPAKSYEFIRKDNKIFGRGVFDMKGFVVSALVNLRKKYRVAYGVLLTSDEEIGGENGVLHWIEDKNLRARLILDTDRGSNINSIVKENLGSATLQLIGTDEHLVDETAQRLREKLSEYHWERYNREIDIIFGDIDLEAVITSCLEKGVNYKILMLNPYCHHKIKGKEHKLYASLLQKNGILPIYTTSSSVSGANHFTQTEVICHQATGGGAHQDYEWLDVRSLQQFTLLQEEFLRLH
jgi:hypothetical protein